MKIVNVIGGLGNQMFQCAFAIALKEIFNEDVYIDIHHYKNPYPKTFRGNNFFHNGYEVSKLFRNFDLPIASPAQVMKYSYYIPNYYISRIARRLLPIRNTEYVQSYMEAYNYRRDDSIFQDKKYFEGYWMTPLYFNAYRNIIIEKFRFKSFDTIENILIEQKLKSSNSITVHIRRGDYVGSSSFGGICTLTYYRNAIREARKFIQNPEFYIFSNDQDWCLNHLGDVFSDSLVHFITHNKGINSYRDMQLMMLARCNILANSSFSWWGAYLNQRDDQLVFCPNKWHNQFDCSKIYVDSWIKIDIG